MIIATKVKNPCCRPGRPGYVCCTYCGKFYTQLGISRHWDKCLANPTFAEFSKGGQK